jgi:tRNA A37 threonylcarbamoyladenosine synthetase subunit TsaC/SUA5/YrdC
MKKTISLEKFLDNISFYTKEAKKEKIFIYPTDTLYGIGTIYDETLSTSEKINTIKQTDPLKSVSVIVPNKQWIINNCE